MVAVQREIIAVDRQLVSARQVDRNHVLGAYCITQDDIGGEIDGEYPSVSRRCVDGGKRCAQVRFIGDVKGCSNHLHPRWHGFGRQATSLETSNFLAQSSCSKPSSRMNSALGLNIVDNRRESRFVGAWLNQAARLRRTPHSVRPPLVVRIMSPTLRTKQPLSPRWGSTGYS